MFGHAGHREVVGLERELLLGAEVVVDPALLESGRGDEVAHRRADVALAVEHGRGQLHEMPDQLATLNPHVIVTKATRTGDAAADGDTLTVFDTNMVQHKIRLHGIDAPEKSQAFGTKAKDALVRSLVLPVSARLSRLGEFENRAREARAETDVQGAIERLDSETLRYREASPITYVTRPLPPTLLIYAGRDNIVEPRFGVLLQRRLGETGTTSVLLEIPWAEHGFDAISNGPSAQLALFETERFLAWALHP